MRAEYDAIYTHLEPYKLNREVNIVDSSNLISDVYDVCINSRCDIFHDIPLLSTLRAEHLLICLPEVRGEQGVYEDVDARIGQVTLLGE